MFDLLIVLAFVGLIVAAAIGASIHIPLKSGDSDL